MYFNDNYVILKENMENVWFNAVFIAKTPVFGTKNRFEFFWPGFDQNEYDILIPHPF